MIPAGKPVSVEAWLAWFEGAKAAQYRAYLCTRVGLDAADAEALLNTARLQVFRHWTTITHPLAYFWRTLQQAVRKQGQRRTYERRRLAAYAWQRRVQAHSAARTARHVVDVLDRLPPRQRRILAWYAQGYADSQVASWLGTTPQAVRVARHGAYRTLRGQCRPPRRPAVPTEEASDKETLETVVSLAATELDIMALAIRESH